ncbi:MAG: glycosyltransferase family 2 protein [Candidatus Omnitrophota bacterium]
MPEITVIIPVYNEEGNIGELAKKVRQVIGPRNELIVVDDGSSDNTFKELDPSVCIVIRHAVNKGKGQAMRTGIAAAAGEVTFFMGGDGQDDPSEMHLFLEAVKKGSDFVIGSRFIGSLTKGSITAVNSFGNKSLTTLFNILFGVRLTDTQAEYKCVRTDKLKALCLTSDRYEIETEMIIRALRKGYGITEVPVTRYPRRHGISNLYQVRFGRIKFGFRILKTMLKGFFIWR